MKRGWIALFAIVSTGCDAVLQFHDVDAGSDAQAETGCTTAGCPLYSLHCEPTSATCVECLVDGDCPRQLGRCDPESHRCFECLASADCRPGESCITAARVCVRQCTTAAQCSGPGPGPGGPATCDTGRGLCVDCAGDGDCHDAHRRICDVVSGECVDCVRDTTCPSDHPRCDPASYRCVACVRDLDCPTSTPICDPSRHACAPR